MTLQYLETENGSFIDFKNLDTTGTQVEPYSNLYSIRYLSQILLHNSSGKNLK